MKWNVKCCDNEQERRAYVSHDASNASRLLVSFSRFHFINEFIIAVQMTKLYDYHL